MRTTVDPDHGLAGRHRYLLQGGPALLPVRQSPGRPVANLLTKGHLLHLLLKTLLDISFGHLDALHLSAHVPDPLNDKNIIFC